MSDMRRMCARRPMFSISLSAIWSLGIATRWFVRKVRIFVDRNPISSTNPSCPLTTMRSPSRNGLSSMIVRVPNSPLSMLWPANAIARPPIPALASSVVSGKPR